MPYCLGQNTFRSKAAIRRHVSAILERARVGDYLAGDDLAVVRELILFHPNAEQKIGAGVKAIRVELTPPFNTKGFFLVRVDGTTTDVSFRECIYPSTQESDFKKACREAITDDVLACKKAAFHDSDSIPCPINGRPITWNDSHVDHSPPWEFADIVAAFIAADQINPSDVELTGSGDNEYQRRFADKAMRERFRKLHSEVAILRVVSKKAHVHMSKPKTERPIGKLWVRTDDDGQRYLGGVVLIDVAKGSHVRLRKNSDASKRADGEYVLMLVDGKEKT